MEKGSEWNKWDLHIHTPYSKGHEYTNGDWNLFFIKLAQITKQKEISVIGINDYWILDGYYRVREAWENNQKFTNGAEEYDLSHIKQIFPIVEYRVDKTVGSKTKLNCHYLFNPANSINDLKEILTKMYITYNNKSKNIHINGSYESIKNIEHTALCLHDDDIKAFELDKCVNKYPFLKAIGYAELDEIRWDQAPTVIYESIEKFDFGFLASPLSSINYKDKAKDKVKTILHCSDAHRYPNDINNTDSKDMGHCYTWIKGETSFAGLKYALEDSNSRIRIQEKNPFFDKTPPYIESIKFPKELAILPNRKITIDTTLCFNRYMNSIIGGRGAGKTTLLEAIQYISENYPDNIVMKEGNQTSERKKILYIPKSSDDISIIDKYLSISPFIFSDKVSIISPDTFRLALSKDLPKLEQNKKTSENTIKTYSSQETQDLFNKYTRTYQEINLLNLFLQDIESLEKSLEQIKPINKDITKINNNMPIEIPNISIDQVITKITENKTQINLKLSLLHEKQSNLKENLEEQFPNKNIESITDSIKEEQQKIQEYSNQITSIQESKEIYKNLSDRLPNFVDIYKKSLSDYINSIRQIWSEKKERHNHKELLSDLDIEVKVVLNINTFLDNLLKFLDNRSYSKDYIIQQLFKSIKDSKIKSFYNSQKNQEVIGDLSDPCIHEFFDIIAYQSIIDFIFQSTTKSRNEWDSKIEMLNSVYSFSYIKIQTNLLYQKKPFEVLSAGEKGVISLLLNLDIGEADIPLLIDQPEDYLDNYFINEKLIPILQEIKQKRQVLMVSHNSNLVVNGDSELVFLAKNISDKLGEFSYISGSLESNTPSEIPNFDKKTMKARICTIMEGGVEAFKIRSKKYGLGNP